MSKGKWDTGSAGAASFCAIINPIGSKTLCYGKSKPARQALGLGGEASAAHPSG